MINLSAQAVSTMFSRLTGLPVRCTEKHRVTPSKLKSVYGIYNKFPEHETILLRADLPLLASLGGKLVGLTDTLIGERIKQSSLDETLRDAMRNVLSSTATLLSGVDRVVFKSMCTDVQFLSGPARSILNSHGLSTSYEVSIQDYTGGHFSIFSD